MSAPEPLARYRTYIAMFLLCLAVVIGVIYILRQEQPRPLIVTISPERAPTLNNGLVNDNPLSQPTPPETQVRAPLAVHKLNLNTATRPALEELPGIGPVLAQRIIDYRNVHGRFRSIEELTEVEGIGDAIYEKVQELITVE